MSASSVVKPKQVHASSVWSRPCGTRRRTAKQLRGLEPESFLRRAHAGLLVFLAAGIGGERVAHVVAAGVAHHDAALLRQPVEPKGGEERVQEARMVGVLDVFHVEL